MSLLQLCKMIRWMLVITFFSFKEFLFFVFHIFPAIYLRIFNKVLQPLGLIVSEQSSLLRSQTVNIESFLILPRFYSLSVHKANQYKEIQCETGRNSHAYTYTATHVRSHAIIFTFMRDNFRMIDYTIDLILERAYTIRNHRWTASSDQLTSHSAS